MVAFFCGRCSRERVNVHVARHRVIIETHPGETLTSN